MRSHLSRLPARGLLSFQRSSSSSADCCSSGEVWSGVQIGRNSLNVRRGVGRSHLLGDQSRLLLPIPETRFQRQLGDRAELGNGELDLGVSDRELSALGGRPMSRSSVLSVMTKPARLSMPTGCSAAVSAIFVCRSDVMQISSRIRRSRTERARSPMATISPPSTRQSSHRDRSVVLRSGLRPSRCCAARHALRGGSSMPDPTRGRDCRRGDARLPESRSRAPRDRSRSRLRRRTWPDDAVGS